MRGVEYKSKGGARIQLEDSSGLMHTIPEKDVHVNLGVYKGKLQLAAEILGEYEAVMKLEATELGVEPELLEMAWELASESDAKEFSLKFLLSLVDDNFFKSAVDKYRAFRLLTSDMGKVQARARLTRPLALPLIQIEDTPCPALVTCEP